MTLIPFHTIPIAENNDPLADLSEFNFVLEPVYFNQGFSTDSRMFIRREIALKLERIQKELNGYRFKIWDGYRSRQVQDNIYQKFWKELESKNPDWDEEKLKKEVGKFVSPAFDETRIPPHSTGGAIDLTLVDDKDNELEMGTAFDFFGDSAGAFYYEIYQTNPVAARNRKLLREAMLLEDFTLDADEWWHFDFGNQSWALKKGEKEARYGEAIGPGLTEAKQEV